MLNIFDYTMDELKDLLNPAFRAKQVWNWIYIHYKSDFNSMLNIPKEYRIILDGSFSAKNIEIVDIVESRDGTIKYLFSTIDGHTFESVLIRMREKKIDDNGNMESNEKITLCISSQIGCRIGCKFCCTGKYGLKRNLSSGEIVEQVVAIKRHNNIPPHRAINIVYMGMGEPLDNFDNVIKAVKILSDSNGLSISPRRQTISTSGISPRINDLGKLNLGVHLAISLHAVRDDVRDKLMPINRMYNIATIIDSVKRYPISSRKRIMFEYLMIKDVNDSIDDAKALLKLLNGIKAKINLILFNPFNGCDFERPDSYSVKIFSDFLNEKGLLCTIRESKGIDIAAACGQLKDKNSHISRETKAI